jgi:hypothetical protein
MELQGKDQTSPYYAWTVGKWWTSPVHLYGLGNVIHMDELLTCEPRDSPPLNSPMQATFFLSLDRRLDHNTWLKHDITSRQISICDSTSWTTVKILSSSCRKFSWVLTLTFCNIEVFSTGTHGTQSSWCIPSLYGLKNQCRLVIRKKQYLDDKNLLNLLALLL